MMRRALLFLAVPVLTCVATMPIDIIQRPSTFKSPFYIYRDFGDRANHGAPSGWMGDYRDISVDMNCTTNPYSGNSCIMFHYSAKGSRYADMAGVVWQSPANNGGDIDGGINLTGAKKLTFWARADQEGSIMSSFTFGGTLGLYPDTDSTGIHDVVLSTNWTKYEIDLTNLDLRYISCFFGWVASRYHNQDGLNLYLDEIQLQ